MSNQPPTTPAAPPTRSGRLMGPMVGIGLLCGLLISTVFVCTKPIIEEKQATALEKAIFRVLPGTSTTAPYALTDDGSFTPATEAHSAEAVVYAGFDSTGTLTGVAIPASGQGYADIIRILYGYDPAREAVVGMYVLESKETPGLGDKIEKDADFLANFEALDVSLSAGGDSLQHTVVSVKSGKKENPWEVDGITGATISSRAIGDILGESTARWVPLIYRYRNDFQPTEPATE
jgi:electron transport complex protein RnfG